MIRAWWKRWPDANVGITTGPESGLLVLDVDGAQGESSVAAFEKEHGPLPDTFTVRTGGGGQHLYFTWPKGTDVRNSASKLALGLDIRGQGGYVVAPPSRHTSGGRYEVNESAIPPVACPDWLLSLIDKAQGAQARQGAPVTGPVIEHPNRTPHLVSLAGSMHKRGMDPGAIEAALIQENLAKCSPPLDEKKVRAIARDIPRRYPNAKNEGRESPVLKPDLVRLADVAARPVDWLWEPFIPLGMLSMISGDPGAGKSFIALAVAADLTRGKLRDGRIVEPASVLYLSVENPIAETVRPRFDALGGDPALFFALRGTLFAKDGEEQRGAITLADIRILDAAIRQTHARLVVVDPIQSYFGAMVDLHRSNETRPILDGLSKLAEQNGCAILLLRHLSKTSGGKAIHRGLGSIDLSAAARSEMLVGSLPDDEDTRAFCHVQTNVGRHGKTLGFSIDAEGRFSWTGESPITASDLLAAPDAPELQGAQREAAEWLREALSSGSRNAKELANEADSVGIKYRTLRRAKETLHVQSRKACFGGGWIWSLSEDGSTDAPDSDEGRLTV
jgi:hypothetical protein